MFFIARRYLMSKKSHSVVNIISVVSLCALLIPVAAVIILLSIFNGFGSMVSSMDRAMEGDLTVTLREGKFFDESELDRVALRGVAGVEAVSYTTEQMLLLEYKGQNRLLMFRGVDSDYQETLPIEEHTYVGRFQVTLGDLERLVIGNSVATNLGIRSLSNIEMSLYSLKTGRLQSYIPSGQHTKRKAVLAGVFTIDQTSEERYGFASRRLVNELVGREGSASRVILRLSESADLERVRQDVERVAGERFRVQSRAELNPAMYHIIRFEKLGILLICSLVMLLASFSLLGALAMLIIEKRGDIETLRAMGATRRNIRQIFRTEGLLISGTAIIGGAVIGVVMTLIQSHFGVVEMPTASMVVSAYPVELQWFDVVTVVAVSLLISGVLSRIVVDWMLRKENK